MVLDRRAIAFLSAVCCGGACVLLMWCLLRRGLIGFSWFLPFTCISVGVLLAIPWVRWRGRLVIYNAEEGRLVDCIRSALDEAGVEYREEVGVFHLPSADTDVRVTVARWLRCAVVRLVPPRPRELVAELTRRLKKALSQAAWPRGLWVGAACVGAGLLVVAEAVGLAVRSALVLLP